MENKSAKILYKLNENDKKINVFSAITGILTGLCNGLFGGGGGMILVPMLTFLLGFKSKNAHATAILIILPLSLLSGMIYASSGSFNFNIGLPVIIGVSVGGILGSFLLSKLSNKVITVIFSVVMAVAGVKMAFL